MTDLLCSWEETARAILQRPGLTVLLGPPDSGKTTFARSLAEQAARAMPLTGIVDSDIGQSSVGPPATIGLALFSSGEPVPPPPWPAEELYFVGSFAPPGHLLPQVVGTVKLARAAESRGAALTLVDTTGLVHGGIGRALKEAKLDALEPRHLVLFASDPQLEAIACPFSSRSGSAVHRVELSPVRRARQAAEREAYRCRMLTRYFQKSRELEIPMQTGTFLSFRGSGNLRSGLLVGIADGCNRTLAVGEVLAVTKDSLAVRAPLPAELEEKIQGIQVGSVSLPPPCRSR